jgi:uncharacterized protein (DUF3820 family)
MPFGKFRGAPLSDPSISSMYLGYVFGFDNLRPGLRDAIADELCRRGLPFGKHKGTPLDEVPMNYLEWILAWEQLLPPWPELIRKEIERRSA